MEAKVWGSSDDGTIQYVSLTREKLEGSMDVLRGSFFLDESVCIGVEITKHPEAAKELEELCYHTAKDGVSIVAVEKSTSKIVAVAFNKLQVKTDDSSYFEKFAANCKYSSSRSLVQFMIDSDSVADLFEICNAKCLLEIMFIATLPEFRKRGISQKLCEMSICLAKNLSDGENVKMSLDGRNLPLEPIPTAVCALFTSFISQKIGRRLGFTKVAEISYEKFIFEGKTFASRIGPESPFTTVECKTL